MVGWLLTIKNNVIVYVWILIICNDDSYTICTHVIFCLCENLLRCKGCYFIIENLVSKFFLLFKLQSAFFVPYNDIIKYINILCLNSTTSTYLVSINL